METHEKKVLELELKYCERCGTLSLRLRGSDVVVCRACARALVGLAGRPALGKRRIERSQLGRVESAFWSEGGNA
jgi:ribosomal protein L37AE/L43A